MDFIDIGIVAGYILIVLCAVAAVGIPLIKSFSDPKSLVKSGIGIGVLLVVFLLSYALADGGMAGTTSGTSKMVGAGIITTYFIFFGAIGGIIYTEISKMVK
ncbi:MAG: hypothetical protein KI790_09525 [Cyclobacteriaceae bacterium]|nr:hypothetical protein [Cyclobacteriaceae bacterium HetDA_MAG_MS6]